MFVVQNKHEEHLAVDGLTFHIDNDSGTEVNINMNVYYHTIVKIQIGVSIVGLKSLQKTLNVKEMLEASVRH